MIQTIAELAPKFQELAFCRPEDLDARVTNHEPSESAIAGDWPMIEAQLPSNWRELGRALGLDPATRSWHPHGSKIRDLGVVLRLVLFHVGANVALATTTAMAAAADLATISPVALHLWMRRIGPWLASLLGALTDAAETFSPARWAGYDIRIVDATVVSRPGSKGTTARVHYAIRLTDLQPIYEEVTDETGGETFRRFSHVAGPKELWLGDRAYGSPPGIAEMTAAGSAVLVRWNRGALPLYDTHGALLDVGAKLARRLTQCGKPREWAAWVHPKDGPVIRGRLCAVRLPPDKAEKARVRARREQGAKVTAETLEMAVFVVVFTTVPKDLLVAEQILELYRLRWQVELTIKRDKSIAGLDRLPNFRDDTIKSWILAKLLLTQIARKISTPEVCVPPCAVAA